MCGCECCQSNRPTCFDIDGTGRGLGAWKHFRCECKCAGCIVRFAEGWAALSHGRGRAMASVAGGVPESVTPEGPQTSDEIRAELLSVNVGERVRWRNHLMNGSEESEVRETEWGPYVHPEGWRIRQSSGLACVENFTEFRIAAAAPAIGQEGQ